MDQTRLEKLLMEEISGVSDPANQLPGWMVTKARKKNPNEMAGLTTLLNLIGQGVETEPATKARLVARAEAILKERHALRDKATGKFASAVEEDDGTITTPLGSHYNAHPMLREALRQSK